MKNDVRPTGAVISSELLVRGQLAPVAVLALRWVLFRCMRLHVPGQEVGTRALAQRHNITVVLVPTEGKKKIKQNPKNTR